MLEGEHQGSDHRIKGKDDQKDCCRYDKSPSDQHLTLVQRHPMLFLLIVFHSFPFCRSKRLPKRQGQDTPSLFQ